MSGLRQKTRMSSSRRKRGVCCARQVTRCNQQLSYGRKNHRWNTQSVKGCGEHSWFRVKRNFRADE